MMQQKNDKKMKAALSFDFKSITSEALKERDSRQMPFYKKIFSCANNTLQENFINKSAEEKKKQNEKKEDEALFVKYYKKKDASKKKVHALLMSYYKLKFEEEDKEEHLCIFAFVSKQVAVRQLKQSANSTVSQHLASYNLEDMPTCMDVAQRGLDNMLIVTLAC